MSRRASGPGARAAAAVAIGLAIALAACGGGSATATTASTPAPAATPGPAWDQVPPLREAAGGRLIGAALFSSGLAGEPVYAAAAGRHFNYVTAEYEMKWDPIEKVQGSFDFSGGDAIVAFAETHDLRVKGHALVWHGATPAWVATLSPPELRIAVQDYIRTVAGHYRGHVRAWDVVNEAIDDSTFGLRSTVFSRGLGDDYVAEAFTLARQVDPEAQLVYNDYGGEGLGRKSDAIYGLVKGLKERGVPIDGVGLQMHLQASSAPLAADIATNIRRLAALGLQVNISEMDVRIADLPGATRLDRQKQVYHDVVAACVAEPRCEAVTLWGFTDAHSWIDATFGPDDPLLFDAQYRAKPAFFGVQDALGGR